MGRRAWEQRQTMHEFETQRPQQQIHRFATSQSQSSGAGGVQLHLETRLPNPPPPPRPHVPKVPVVMFNPNTPWTSTPSPPPPLPAPPMPSYTEPNNPIYSGMGTPSVMMAPPIIDTCPCFIPSKYHRWKREMRLWMAGFPAATASHFLSKIIAVFPPPSKITGMSYMKAAGASPQMRTVEALISMPDERYAETDTDRSWAWRKEFATFTKKPAGGTQ